MTRAGVLEPARFAVLQFLFWSGIVCFEAFMVPYLRSLGYTAGQIGPVMSAIFGLAVVGQPVLGSLSDRVRSPRWLVAGALGVAGGAVVMLPMIGDVYVLILGVALVYSLTANSMPAVLDAWLLERRSVNRRVNYGVSRGLGSAGFATAGIVLGVVTDRHGPAIVFPVFFAIAVASALIALSMPHCERALDARIEERRGIDAAVAAVLRNKPYLALLTAAFLGFTGLRAGLTYLPILVEDAGGSLADVGLAHSIGAISEIPIFFLATPLLRRFDGRRLIATVLLLLAARLAAYPFLTSPMQIMALQATHGVTFGVFLAATVDYIHRIAPPAHRGFFQALAPSVYFGIGSIAGSWLGGLIMEACSTTALYLAAAATALVAAPLFVVAGRTRVPTLR